MNTNTKTNKQIKRPAKVFYWKKIDSNESHSNTWSANLLPMATSTESSSAAVSSTTLIIDDVSVIFHMNPRQPMQAVFTVTVPADIPLLQQELQAIADHIAAQHH